jgi:hypothetical protein
MPPLSQKNGSLFLCTRPSERRKKKARQSLPYPRAPATNRSAASGTASCIRRENRNVRWSPFRARGPPARACPCSPLTQPTLPAFHRASRRRRHPSCLLSYFEAPAPIFWPSGSLPIAQDTMPHLWTAKAPRLTKEERCSLKGRMAAHDAQLGAASNGDGNEGCGRKKSSFRLIP